MTREIVAPRDRQHWLQLRTQDVTSTDCAALFGMSPYRTLFELWHEKASGVVVEIQESERMKWGKRLEASIAQGVAADMGWKAAPLPEYIRDPEARIGSSFDWKIDSPTDGPGIMEIKCVDAQQYKRNWRDDGAVIEGPAHIELQVQHQLEVSGMEWAAIVALINGNTVRIVMRRRLESVGQMIRSKVVSFWDSVAKGNQPSADYSRDADVIKELYSQVKTGEVIDAEHDAEITRLVEQWHRAKRLSEEAVGLMDTYRAQLLQLVGSAERVTHPLWTLNLARTKDSAGTLITADMVGTTIGGRKGYRQFKLTETQS